MTTTTTRIRLILGTATAFALCCGGPSSALAQGAGDEAETTIRLMGAPDAELPAEITRQIELPPAARENAAAVERAERGLERANDNRERRESGLARADEVRERGMEMSEEARENAENRSRAEENRPDVPGRRDDPGASD
jgi:hypothetical protein